jgi:general secretion pathway protein G
MSSERKQRREGSAGFTLIELLIILVVIGVIAAIAISNLMGAYDRARQGATVADLRSIASAIEAYAVDHSVPPVGTIADLELALHGYQQSSIPQTDHWGHMYVYTSNANEYSVMSLGKDGVDGPDSTWLTRNEFERDIIVSNGVFTAGPEVR